jgi:hypothetical protein
MSFPLRAAVAVTALGLVGSAVWVLNGDGSDTAPDRVTLGRIENIALTTKHDCADLLSYYRTQGARTVGPYGLDGGPQIYSAMEMTADSLSAAKAAPSAAGSAARDAAGSGTTDSSTNVQVAGVDEGDIVKTDGDLMVAVVNGEVQITRLAGDKTKRLATWTPAEGAAQSVLLDGTTAVIIGDQNGGIPIGATAKRAPYPDLMMTAGVTDLTVLDLADPANPRPVRRLELAGNRSGEARLVDGELRLALTAGASGMNWKQPKYPDWTPSRNSQKDLDKAQAAFEASQKRATAANKRLIEKSTIDNWIPQATVTPLDAAGKPSGPAVKRPLIDCENVALPPSFSGLRTLALVSTDLHADTPLTTWRSAGVIADGSTVYATADHVWVSTSRWDVLGSDTTSAIVDRFMPSAASTQIHRFDTPRGGQPQYVASGEITGSLLNQFAMDEKDGLLRVASTTEGASAPTPIGGPAESGVVDPAVVDPGVAQSGVAKGGGSKDGAAGGEVASDGAAGDGVVGGSTGSDSTKPSAGAVTPPAVVPSPNAASTPVEPAEPSDGITASNGATTPSTGASSSAVRPTPKPKLSEGRVTVLKVDGERLAQVGVVTGLGLGERIRGVRFVGDVGYVVTYRQTDPLYTVDLTDPANPRVRGELSVLGYSAYLHPAGDDRLLGLGQDGTETGSTTGLQLSLFDVGNLDSPRRLDRVRLAGAWSDAESDHHAFTMAGDLVLIPYSSWGNAVTEPSAGDDAPVDGGYLERFDAGVIAIRVGADGLGTPTTLRPIADGPITFNPNREGAPSIRRETEATPMRTVVQDGTIYTLTPTGVAAHSAGDFTRLTYAEF